MRTRHLMLVALTALPLSAAMCERPFNYVAYARPANLGEESTIEIVPSHEQRRAVSREVLVRGKGTLLVNAIPQNTKSQLDIVVIPKTGSSIPVAQGSPPLEAQGVDPGNYYVVLRSLNGVQTRAKLNVVFKPDDAEAASGSDAKPEGAVRLKLNGREQGSVDHTNMDKTDHLLAHLTETGTLRIRAYLEPVRGNITVELQPPSGNWTPLHANGIEIKDAPAGDYLIKVAADDGAAGTYTIETFFEAGDPCGAGGDDCTAEGANDLILKPKPGDSTLVASARDSVDFDKRDSTDWYKVSLPDKGKLAVQLKLTERAAKVVAELVENEDDDSGQRIRTGFNVDVAKKTYWIKVHALEKGAASKYTLELTYYPNVYIDAQIVELDKRSGCIVIVNRGTNAGVRPGVNANVTLGGQNVPGYVDQAFPAISRVRVTTNDCSFRPGTVVQIQGM